MNRTVSATEARVRFGEVMRRAIDEGEAVFVERGGRPAVVVLSVAAYEELHRRRADPGGPRLLERARLVRERSRRELGDREASAPEDLLRETREARDVGLADLR